MQPYGDSDGGLAPRALPTSVLSAEARSGEKHRETLSSMSKACLLTFNPHPCSTYHLYQVLLSKLLQQGPKSLEKVHTNVFLTVTLDYAHRRFLLRFFSFCFEANQSMDWRRVMPTFSHCILYLPTAPYGLQGPCRQGPCFISLSLPQSLA